MIRYSRIYITRNHEKLHWRIYNNTTAHQYQLIPTAENSQAICKNENHLPSFLQQRLNYYVRFSSRFCSRQYEFDKGIQRTLRTNYKQQFQFFEFICKCQVNIFSGDGIINQILPEVLINLALKKKKSLIFNFL